MASSHSENCNVEAATFSVFASSTCKSEIGLDIIVMVIRYIVRVIRYDNNR